jgi:hypothetical protein
MSYGVKIVPRIMLIGATKATITLLVIPMAQMIVIVLCARGVMSATPLIARIAIVFIYMVATTIMTKIWIAG